MKKVDLLFGYLAGYHELRSYIQILVLPSAKGNAKNVSGDSGRGGSMNEIKKGKEKVENRYRGRSLQDEHYQQGTKLCQLRFIWGSVTIKQKRFFSVGYKKPSILIQSPWEMEGIKSYYKL